MNCGVPDQGRIVDQGVLLARSTSRREGDGRWTVDGWQHRRREVRDRPAMPASSSRPGRRIDRRRWMPRAPIASGQVRRPHRPDGSRSARCIRQDPRFGGYGEGDHDRGGASPRRRHSARVDAVGLVGLLGVACCSPGRSGSSCLSMNKRPAVSPGIAATFGPHRRVRSDVPYLPSGGGVGDSSPCR